MPIDNMNVFSNGWIIVCPAGRETSKDAVGDSTLYIEHTDRKHLQSGGYNSPKRPNDGTVRGTLASGWFENDDVNEFGSQPWYPYRERIGFVKVLDPWRPQSGRYLFDGLTNCREFDLLQLDTSKCTSFEGMFRGCTSVRELLDLDRLNTSNVTNTSYMFMNCLSLRAISVAGWDVSCMAMTDYMFSGCSTYVLASASQDSFVENALQGATEHGVWKRISR